MIYFSRQENLSLQFAACFGQLINVCGLNYL
jgi:hypothetical protein